MNVIKPDDVVKYAGKKETEVAAKLAGAKLNPERILPFELGRCTSANVALPQQVASGKAKDGCLYGGLLLSCSRQDFVWKPKDPSPLAERLAEIGRAHV